MAGTRNLDGAVVAVVGAAGGLGSSIVEVLRSRGAKVLRTGRTAGPDIDIEFDLRDNEGGVRIVEAASSAHGRLDGVINAAGIVAFGDLADTDDIVVEELFLTNSMGPIWLAKRVSDALAESQGFFVSISGVVADEPMPGMSAYSASKAAVAAAMDSIRRELRRRKVAVIDVRPPHTETGLATRPLAGTAPKMPEGLAPDAVAERIVAAIEAGDTVVTADQF